MRILNLSRLGILGMSMDEINALPTKVVDGVNTIVQIEGEVKSALAEIRSKSRKNREGGMGNKSRKRRGGD